MRTSQCAVYQVKETPEYRDVRFRSYEKLRMGTNTHIFDCGRGYGETKSPSSCKWPVTPEGVIVLHCETCSERE